MTKNGFPLCKIGNNECSTLPVLRFPRGLLLKLLYFAVLHPADSFLFIGMFLDEFSFFSTFELQHIETVTDEEEEGQEADSAAVMGSFSAQLGYSNPYVYSQFSLRTTEQRINQIVLLQVRAC